MAYEQGMKPRDQGSEYPKTQTTYVLSCDIHYQHAVLHGHDVLNQETKVTVRVLHGKVFDLVKRDRGVWLQQKVRVMDIRVVVVYDSM